MVQRFELQFAGRDSEDFTFGLAPMVQRVPAVDAETTIQFVRALGDLPFDLKEFVGGEGFFAHMG